MQSEADDRAAYIGEKTFQLAKIARTDGFELLAHLLDMATLEAESRKLKRGTP